MPTKKVRDYPGCCNDGDHFVPFNYENYFEPGYYEHTCPSCGKVTKFTIHPKHIKKSEPGIPWPKEDPIWPYTPYNPSPWLPGPNTIPTRPNRDVIWCSVLGYAPVEGGH